MSYFATILETASESGAELKAAITQTGDVIWSMHKKKNSASVLAGEMILTFYKPNRVTKAKKVQAPANQGDPQQALSAAFDLCLANGQTSFTSEALFNRLVIELWHRRALGCLALDREEFSTRLEDRGWSYNPKTHLWARREVAEARADELGLLGVNLCSRAVGD